MPTRDIDSVLSDHAEVLLARPEVVMVARGELPDKTPCIQIYLRKLDDTTKQKIGEAIEGHPVQFILSDEIRPLN